MKNRVALSESLVGCTHCRFVGRLMLYLKAQTFCHVFLRVQVFTTISLDRLHVSSRTILAMLTLEQEGGIGRLLLSHLIMSSKTFVAIEA